MYTSRNMKEYLLKTNEFNEPATVKASDATGLTLVRLLLLMPGTNPSHPAMGVGLKTYRFMTENDLPQLQARIEDQIRTYLPLSLTETPVINLQVKPSKYLLITIIIDNIEYVFDTEDTDIPIQLSDITIRNNT